MHTHGTDPTLCAHRIKTHRQDSILVQHSHWLSLTDAHVYTYTYTHARVHTHTLSPLHPAAAHLPPTSEKGTSSDRRGCTPPPGTVLRIISSR